MSRDSIGVIVALVVVVILVTAIFGPVYTVGAGERAVLTTWGNPGTESIGPGLQWKMPIMQTPHILNVQTQKYVADCEAASADLQDVKTTIAVNYHLDPVMIPNIYTQLGFTYESTVIDPKVQETVKAATAKFTAYQLINNRAVVQAKIETSLRDALSPYHIIVEGISVTNFKFNSEFQAAIEKNATATQDLKTAEQQYQKNVIDQKSKLVELETQAKGMEAQKAALTPELVEKYQIDAFNRWIDKWDGHAMPTTVFGGGGNGGSGILPTYSLGGLGVGATAKAGG